MMLVMMVMVVVFFGVIVLLVMVMVSCICRVVGRSQQTFGLGRFFDIDRTVDATAEKEGHYVNVFCILYYIIVRRCW